MPGAKNPAAAVTTTPAARIKLIQTHVRFGSMALIKSATEGLRLFV
jgi:hypothetical protein